MHDLSVLLSVMHAVDLDSPIKLDPYLEIFVELAE